MITFPRGARTRACRIDTRVDAGVAKSRDTARRSACATLLLLILASAALAQPEQPAPVRPSLSMQDANLRPALPGSLRGVGIDQRLDQRVPLDLIFRCLLYTSDAADE